MKRTLLLISLVTFGTASAQLTQSNEPVIGESTSMYLCDSNYTNYANVTGSGVTWDYSQIASYAGQTRTVQVVNPTTTPNASYYGAATKAMEIGSNLITYFDSDASSRFSQGFVFTEPSLGDIVVTFETDDLTQMNYPFAYGNSLNDSYIGTIYYSVITPTSSALAGSATVSVDGEGTLSFPIGVNVANVIRLKSIDTALFNEPFLLGDIQVIREQYEYYDLATQNLPIFIHSSIVVTQVGATTPLANSSIVLSKYPTVNIMRIEEQTISVNIYPSPATDNITVEGIEMNDATIQIIDQAGKVVKTLANVSSNEINISDLENGIYFIAIQSSGSRAVSKFVKK